MGCADLARGTCERGWADAAGGRLTANGRWMGVNGGLNPINAIKNLVDTGTARLTKVRSMPVISADDATYEEKRFAREQSRVLRRKMGEGDMEAVAPLAIRDFIIRGTAWGKVCRYDGDTEFERVPAYEIVYDHREALYAKCMEALSTIAHVRPTLTVDAVWTDQSSPPRSSIRRVVQYATVST